MKPVIDYVHSKGPSAAPSDSPQFPSACLKLSVQCLNRRGLCHDIGKRRTHARRQARRVRAQCTRRALSPSRMPAGLAFGLYTCGGTKTCVGGRVGSEDHWEQDAAAYAEWGVDWVKMDWHVRVVAVRVPY